MPVELKIPEAGESVTEVQIGQWRKSEGDKVEVDEVLVEVESDKAAMDLPAPASGVLTKILKNEGDEATPGEVIAQIEESTDGAGAGASAQAEAEEKEEKAEAKQPPERKEPPSEEPRRKDPPPKEQPRKEPPREKPERKEPPPKESPGEKRAVPESRTRVHPADGAGLRVTPAARRLLEQQGLEASEVEATGPGGRLLKEDVLRHMEGKIERPSAGAEAGAAPPAETRETETPPERPPADDEEKEDREEQVVAMSPMRRTIAKNLVKAQQTAALLTTFNEADMSAVIALRKKHQEVFTEKFGIKLGFMPFFIKASIEALKRFPAVNAEVREDNKIVYKNYYDIGVAVGGGKGLVVPVLRNAERMSFAEIELAIADFAKRAQNNQIELSELQGGTFTISNGGVYGSMLSTPIVNPPQSGILGLHKIEDRPAVVNGEIVVRPIMYLALTYDHRIVDGREAVTFLRHIKGVIEDPMRILIEV